VATRVNDCLARPTEGPLFNFPPNSGEPFPEEKRTRGVGLPEEGGAFRRKGDSFAEQRGLPSIRSVRKRVGLADEKKDWRAVFFFPIFGLSATTPVFVWTTPCSPTKLANKRRGCTSFTLKKAGPFSPKKASWHFVYKKKFSSHARPIIEVLSWP